MALSYSDTNRIINHCNEKRNSSFSRTFGKTQFNYDEIINYLGWGLNGYGMHISDLVIYDNPKELSEFRKPCKYGEESDISCFVCEYSGYAPDMHIDCFRTVTRPPQSWCYVEECEI